MELVRGVDFLSFVRGSRENAPVITRSWVEAAPGDETARTEARPSEPEARAGAPLTGADHERFRAALGQLSAGLEHLHAARRIHRDIKPSNVLVDERGHLVIVDFGLAAATDQERPATTSDFFGTPRYMSPEQATGRALGPASDWFSVGVLMFEALTGRTPERRSRP
jgi:serine/threonine protein kinase